MRQVFTSVRRFLASESGPTTVEYAVMGGFIIAVAVAGITVLGQATLGLYVKSSDEMP
jgi:Flp pilus assembly pilin Flp